MKKIIYFCNECKKELKEDWISIDISRIGRASRSSTTSILFAGLRENDDNMDFCDFDCLKKFVIKYTT